MTITPAASQFISGLHRILAKVPSGRLITFGALSGHLKTSPRHITTVLYSLTGDADLPWHRVVADGGAIGRHERRDQQIKRLQAEGVAVSLGGFVQDFSRVVIADLDAPMPAPATQITMPLGRSRGIKDRSR